jgi:hypothetical protein
MKYNELMKMIDDAKNGKLETQQPKQSQETQNNLRVDPATDKQLAYITILGYEISQKLTKSQASQMITNIKNGDAESFGYKPVADTTITNEVY